MAAQMTRPQAPNARSGGGRSRGFHDRLGASLELLRRHVLDVSGDGPDVTERVLERPGAIAVELVLHRPLRPRAGFEGALEHGVDIREVQHDADARAAERARPAVTHLGMLVPEHD